MQSIPVFGQDIRNKLSMLYNNGIVIAKHIFFYQVCWIVRPEAAFMAAHGNPMSGSYLNFKKFMLYSTKINKAGVSGR